MTDRELVEYLDESVVWKEGTVTEWVGDKECIEFNPNPTPTLEWMLDRLLLKKNEISFDYDFEHYRARIFYGENGSFDRESFWGCIAKTQTLALRGAVEKLITSEESK